MIKKETLNELIVNETTSKIDGKNQYIWIRDYYVTDEKKLSNINDPKLADTIKEMLEKGNNLKNTIKNLIVKAITDINNWYLEAYYLRYDVSNMIANLDSESGYLLTLLNFRWHSNNMVSVYLDNMAIPLMDDYIIIQEGTEDIKEKHKENVSYLVNPFDYSFVYMSVQINSTNKLFTSLGNSFKCNFK